MTADESQDLTRTPTDSRSGRADDVAAADAAVLARHAELVAIDHVIGLEAAVARLEHDLSEARARVVQLKSEVEERDAEITAIRSSRTWRVGRLFTGPFSRMRR